MQEHSHFAAQLKQGLAAMQRMATLSYQHSPRQLVYQRDQVKLYHYQPQTKKPHPVPLLIAFATVNRPDILNLMPNHSFIDELLKQGIDVYLLDWGYPSSDDANRSFSDYIDIYLRESVRYLKEKQQLPAINLLGICQGGVMSVCYAAITRDIQNLILISTPIDFHTKDNVIAKVLRKLDPHAMTSRQKNLPGAWLTQFFISLRPFELLGQKYLNFLDRLDDQEKTELFLRLEKWLHDAPDQTAQSWHEFYQHFYCDNQLIKNNIHIHGKPVNLQALTMPIFNIVARYDDIVPMSASTVLKKQVSTADFTQQSFPSGHIGIYVSDRVVKKLPRAIAKWLKKRI